MQYCSNYNPKMNLLVFYWTNLLYTPNFICNNYWCWIFFAFFLINRFYKLNCICNNYWCWSFFVFSWLRNNFYNFCIFPELTIFTNQITKIIVIDVFIYLFFFLPLFWSTWYICSWRRRCIASWSQFHTNIILVCFYVGPHTRENNSNYKSH